jgi:hypothetical protein
MAVYGPGRHPQNIIWAEAKRSKCLNLNSQLIFVLRYQKFTYYAKHTYKSFTCSRLFNTKHGQTCIKRSSLGHRKSGLIRQVTS